ncbi:hypothetical protein N7493_006176 [Penicillium malachiteum]|uniref:Uncharacterized protein n=1 Tax=Penicillium malachiteum TaxID=1324776 RepID=A0AAD6HKR9_9EURO|nr:hypothetical protein N7493_006176 [Penicillium malachiteum]
MNKMILSCIFAVVCALLVAAVLRVRSVRARREQLTPRPAPLNECGQQEALPDMTPSDPTPEQLLATRVAWLECQLNEYQTGYKTVCTELNLAEGKLWRLNKKQRETETKLAEVKKQARNANDLLQTARDEIASLRPADGAQPVPQAPANANEARLAAELHQTTTELQQTTTSLNAALEREATLTSEFQNALAAEKELYRQQLGYLLGLSKEEFNEVVIRAFPDIARQISRQDQVPLIDHRDIPVGTDEMDIDTMAPTSTEYRQTDIDAMEGVEYTVGSPANAQDSDMAEMEVDSVSGPHENAPNERETVTQELSNLEREIAQLAVPSRSHLQGCFNAIDRLKIALGNQDAAHAQLGSESRRAVKEDNRDSQSARDFDTELAQLRQTEAELRELLRRSRKDAVDSRGDAENWWQQCRLEKIKVSGLESRCKSLEKQAQINDQANGG